LRETLRQQADANQNTVGEILGGRLSVEQAAERLLDEAARQPGSAAAGGPRPEPGSGRR
jgi:hypothetical protein